MVSRYGLERPKPTVPPGAAAVRDSTPAKSFSSPFWFLYQLSSANSCNFAGGASLSAASSGADGELSNRAAVRVANMG